MTTRLLVAHPEALGRAGLVRLLGTSAQLEVVGDAKSADEVLALVVSHDPDVVLVDEALPPGGSVGVLEALAAQRGQQPPVVVVIGDGDQGDGALDVLGAGASGFVSTDSSLDHVVHVIRCCAAGGYAVSAATARVLLRRCAQRPGARRARSDLSGLTPRERDVLMGIAEGLSNAEIGVRLGIAPSTVNTHTTHLHRKLGTRRRTQLAIVAADLDD